MNVSVCVQMCVVLPVSESLAFLTPALAGLVVLAAFALATLGSLFSEVGSLDLPLTAS